MRYLVVIRKAKDNYSASSPDVPGCFAVGDTVEDARESFRQTLQFHLEGLREAGGQIPEEIAVGEYVVVE